MKRSAWMLVAAALLAAAVVAVALNSPTAAQGGAQRWEYVEAVWVLDFGGSGLQVHYELNHGGETHMPEMIVPQDAAARPIDMLNFLGGLGWELLQPGQSLNQPDQPLTPSRIAYLFKRPLQ